MGSERIGSETVRRCVTTRRTFSRTARSTTVLRSAFGGAALVACKAAGTIGSNIWAMLPGKLVGCPGRLLTRSRSRCERPRADHHAGGQPSAAGAPQEATARQVRDHSFFLPVRASRMGGFERELYRGDQLAGSGGGRVKLRPSASPESR